MREDGLGVELTPRWTLRSKATSIRGHRSHRTGIRRPPAQTRSLHRTSDGHLAGSCARHCRLARQGPLSHAVCIIRSSMLDSRLKCPCRWMIGAPQTDAPEAILDHPIKPELCPECGYNLSGLPDEGACPECGVTYGQEIVVYGWGTDAYATLINRKPYPLFTLVLVLAALLFALLPLLALLLWWPLGIIGAIIYVRYGINLYRRYRALAVLPAPVQLRLASQGYSVRIGCGPPRWLSWDWVYAVLVDERQSGSTTSRFTA